MIRFADNFNPNNDDDNDQYDQFKKYDIDKVKKLLKAIFDSKTHNEGAFHESATLVDLVTIVDEVLFQEKHNSISLIIDKNANNSLDISVKKIT